MADTETYTSQVPPGMEEDEESVVNLSTLVLALLTLAVYILFLKPTAETDNNATPNNNNTPHRTTGVRDRQRQRGRRQVAQQPAPPPASQPPQGRRRLQLSDNALEVLQHSQSLPPHVASASSKRSIGGFEMLSENGLVAFSHTTAAAASASSRTPRGSSGDTNDPDTTAKAAASLLQRKERAKILSRLFAATNIDTSKGLPAPPSKGSTFVIGISRAKHLLDSDQLPSLIRVVKGLAIHYTVLLVVSLDDAAASNDSSSSSYESTQKLHAEAIGLLQGSSNDSDETATGLSESILPSHRILLAGSAKGRVAMVRQLSTNIGLTVDFDPTVREELERFGYEVSIVNDWKTILPAKDVVKA